MVGGRTDLILEVCYEFFEGGKSLVEVSCGLGVWSSRERDERLLVSINKNYDFSGVELYPRTVQLPENLL